MKSFICSILANLVLVAAAQAESPDPVLQATYLNLKLPTPNAAPAPYYDGEDHIYLLGGFDTPPYNEILVFSISSESIEVAGALPGPAEFGTVQGDGAGNIYYFGGGQDFDQVYKFDPSTNTSSVVYADTQNHIPLESKSVRYNKTSSMVYIFGGLSTDNNILAFDLESLCPTPNIVASLKENVAKGASVRVGNKVVMLPSKDGRGRRAYLMDLDTFEVEEVGTQTLPGFQYSPSLVTDGKMVYGIGGYWPAPGYPTDGIVQFNSETFENRFIPVNSLFVGDATMFITGPASVYVPNTNRIYCFGGMIFNEEEGQASRDEIFYIDLTPLN